MLFVVLSMMFSIIDIETTGGAKKDTKITEIAIILHNGKEVVKEFATLINPECEIPKFITRLTGISNEMVQKAPKFYEVAKQIIELTQDTVFVAHNVGFDYSIIRKEFKELGYDYRRPHLCTVRSSRYILPGHNSYSLGKLSADLGIQLENRHRALGDTKATAELFTLLVKKSEGTIEKFIQQEINPKILHPGLDLNTIEQLPSKTGVYIFKNTDEKIIYIGKSKSIKSRVLQHLKNNSTRKGIQLKEEIAQVDYKLTGSELISLLLESELIKKNIPKYNRRLVRNKNNVGLFSYTNQNGYITFYVQHVSKTEMQPFTTFENKRDAMSYLEKCAEKFELCKKLVGVYATPNACFGYQTKQCKGACVAEEDAEQYNDRAVALQDYLSYSNVSFFVVEKGRSRGELGLVLVESGAYRGYGFINANDENHNIDDWKDAILHKEENRDAKRIIQAYVRKYPKLNLRKFDPFESC